MLKDSQIYLYKSIKRYYEDNGYSPTIRELQEICSYKSTSTVYDHLKVLERAEYIKMGERKSRSIKLL